MKPKHTPGPWKYISVNMGDRIEFRVLGDQMGIVRDVCGELERERRANARLIAAAPELLDACKAALSLHPIEFSELDPNLLEDAVILKVLAAIAKAEGSDD